MKYDPKNERGLKVRLTNDLTRYHKSLVIGSIGKTVGHQFMWSRNYYDRFVTVQFKETTLDVLWKGLEPVKEA